MEMVMPNTYSVLENEEMMYLDGGWDSDIAFNNLRGLIWKWGTGLAAAMKCSSTTLFSITKNAMHYMWSSILNGLRILGATNLMLGAVLGLSVGAIAFSLGTWRMFY